MTRAVAGFNPIWGHREQVQFQPEDGRIWKADNSAAKVEGTGGGWEGVGRTANLYSPSLHVSFCVFLLLLLKKEMAQNLPFLLTIVMPYPSSSTSNFYLSLFTGQEEGSGVNSSACHVGLTVWMFHVPQWFNTRNKSNMFFVLLSNFFKFKDMGWIKSTQIIPLTLVEFI